MNNIKGYTQVLSEAMESQVDQEKLDEQLSECIKAGDLECCKELLASGANPNSFTKLAPWSPPSHQLDIAVYSYMHDTPFSQDIMDLLLKNGAEPDMSNALDTACRKGMTVIVKMLLDAGADIEKKGENQETPLQAAGRHVPEMEKETKELLITMGADPFSYFDSVHDLIDYFDGDVSWIPDGPVKAKINKISRGSSMFGV